MNLILEIIIVNSVLVLNCVNGLIVSTPPPKVIFFSDRGFEVSMEWDKGITLFEFHGKKNVLLYGAEAGDWNINVTKPTNGRFVYRNLDVKFEPGDVLYYWTHVNYNGVGYNSLYLSEEAKSFTDSATVLMQHRTSYDFPDPLIKVLFPRGFEVSIPAEEGLTSMVFHGQINEELIGLAAGKFDQEIKNPENGRFIFRDLDTKVKPGDMLYYWLHVIFNGLTYNLMDQIHEFKEDHFKLPTPNVQDPSCIGVSKVNGQTGFCENTEIFYEDFSGNSLVKMKWDFERRFGGDPDYEFVLYSDQNARVYDGKLEIRPSENKQLGKHLEIQNCTGKPLIPECLYEGSKVNDIMAPIMTSRINTRRSFSFQYGRIEIRAKLPSAIWTVPLVVLEPKEFKYESEGYRNGQIRIAFMENNPTVRLKVKQGPLLGADEPHRTSYMSELLIDPDWESQFHTFAVEWKPDGIKTYIDGQLGQVRNWRTKSSTIPGSQAWIGSETPVAPFDQEFFITLGVSVGGVNDFKSGTPWDLTSPMQKRQFYRSNWKTYWTQDNSALEVDYVKVVAV